MLGAHWRSHHDVLLLGGVVADADAASLEMCLLECQAQDAQCVRTTGVTHTAHLCWLNGARDRGGNQLPDAC